MYLISETIQHLVSGNILSFEKDDNKLIIYDKHMSIKGDLAVLAKLFLDYIMITRKPVYNSTTKRNLLVYYKFSLHNDYIFDYETFMFNKIYDNSPRFAEFKEALNKMLLLY